VTVRVKLIACLLYVFIAVISVCAQHCISAGSGERLVSEYKTSVLYHNNSPHWNETVRVRTFFVFA